MEIKTLREWLIYKKGQVSTAINKPSTLGELMEVVELLIEQEDKKTS